jgi:hypothetical protein
MMNAVKNGAEDRTQNLKERIKGDARLPLFNRRIDDNYPILLRIASFCRFAACEMDPTSTMQA